jgi:hypothetical protein
MRGWTRCRTASSGLLLCRLAIFRAPSRYRATPIQAETSGPAHLTNNDHLQPLPLMEPAGIEPATSCLQNDTADQLDCLIFLLMPQICRGTRWNG